MSTNFICPRCKKRIKVGKLRARYKCPLCGYTMLITKEEKLKGKKNTQRNFLNKR